MMVMTLIMVTLLVIMGLFHFYWAFGGRVGLDKVIPTQEGKALFQPGVLVTLLVGVVLLGFAWVAYTLHFGSAGMVLISAGWGLAGLFFLRAIGDFKTVGFFKVVRDTPFAEYDTKFYSPLCLFLAIMFATLSALQ